MKKLVLFLLVVCMSLTPISAYAESTAESSPSTIKFRDYEWGTSYDEIYQKEIASDPSLVKDKDYAAEGNSISRFYDDVAGYKMFAVYYCNDGGLYRGYYALNESHTNKTQYYYDFKDLADKITSIYGEPSDKKELWYDDLYKDTPSDWGMSFAVGYSKFIYTWIDGEGNQLNLMIWGDNYKIQVCVFYDSAEQAKQPPEKNTNGL